MPLSSSMLTFEGDLQFYNFTIFNSFDWNYSTVLESSTLRTFWPAYQGGSH